MGRWSVVAGLATVLVLGAYAGLLVANAGYLGWSDAKHFLGQPRLWARLGLTVATAGAATLVAMALALPAGYALARLTPPAPRLVAVLVDLPTALPPAAVGVFLLAVVHGWPVEPVLRTLGLSLARSPLGVVLCQVAVTTAFAVRLAAAAFRAVPERTEAVARALGATWGRALWRVTLPLARRDLAAAALVVFARACAEWESLMLFVGASQGRTDTLPFAVYLDWNGGLMGWVVSMSLVSVAVAAAAAGCATAIGGRTHAP